MSSRASLRRSVEPRAARRFNTFGERSARAPMFVLSVIRRHCSPRVAKSPRYCLAQRCLGFKTYLGERRGARRFWRSSRTNIFACVNTHNSLSVPAAARAPTNKALLVRARRCVIGNAVSAAQDERNLKRPRLIVFFHVMRVIQNQFEVGDLQFSGLACLAPRDEFGLKPSGHRLLDQSRLTPSCASALTLAPGESSQGTVSLSPRRAAFCPVWPWARPFLAIRLGFDPQNATSCR